MSPPITFTWPGDLHLDEPQRPNHLAAHQIVDEINALIQPDFVQFAGDNVQHARETEFALFEEITRHLTMPWHALVGDHDAHHDGACHAHRAHVGETRGAFSLHGVRFILLNTMEFRPLGMTDAQVIWFRYEVDAALQRGEKVVIFQHHYPFKVCESFTGPGLAEWREIIQTRPITAVFSGHTHYGQIANDGRNVYIATRSVGEPEGGAAGYAVVHLQGDDLAIKYRTIEEHGPLVMITHPRQLILCTGPEHIVSGPDECRARIWSKEPITAATFRIDGGPWVNLNAFEANEWRGPLAGDRLAKGEHLLEVCVQDSSQATGTDQLIFQLDRSARFTAVPRVEPTVKSTQFC